MSKVLEGPEWDKQREEIEKQIVETLTGRATALGWINDKGKLTKRGKDAAMDVVIGIATGFQIAKHPASNWMNSQAWLCSVRGVNERFKFAG